MRPGFRGVSKGAGLISAANLGPSGTLSAVSASGSTAPADNSTLITFTVTAKDFNNVAIASATVAATCTNSSNSTLSSPAMTDSSGVTTFTLKASTAATRTVTVTIGSVPVSTTVAIIFTATGQTIDRTKSTVTLQAASANAGDSAVLVTLQGIDTNSVNMSTGGSTVVFSHTGGSSVISISATTDVGNGTYTALITPTTAGTATTMSCTIAGADVTTSMPTFTVTTSTYANGDILHNFAFDMADITTAWIYNTSYHAFNSGNGGVPQSGTHGGTISNEVKAGSVGSKVLKRVIPVCVTDNQDDTATVYCTFGRPSTGPFWYAPPSPANTSPAVGVDRIFTRFRFFLDTPTAMDGILKLNIYESYGPDQQYGGWYLSGGNLVFHQISFKAPTHQVTTTIVSLSSSWNGVAMLGNWHTLEADYWVNNSPTGNYSAKLWVDDIEITDSNATIASPGSYTNGRIECGASGNHAYTIGWMGLATVLNSAPDNNVATNIWLDKVSISTTGRVGP